MCQTQEIIEAHVVGVVFDPRLAQLYNPVVVFCFPDRLQEFKTYAGIVAEKSLLRRMIRANEEIAGACYTQKDDVSEILNQAEKKRLTPAITKLSIESRKAWAESAVSSES